MSTSIEKVRPPNLSSNAPILYMSPMTSSIRTSRRRSGRFHDPWTGWTGTLISRRVLVPRHVSPRRVNQNIFQSCSKRAFTWRNEVTSVSVFNIVVACL